jgi:fermentation-respiration switch protein FrsA (DUF1100 family)
MMFWVFAALGVLATVLLVYYAYGGALAFSLVFDSTAPKDRVFDSPAAKLTPDNEAERARKDACVWFDENARDVVITSRDGLKLSAKLFMAQNTGAHTIICMHGFRGNVHQMAPAARRFVQAGWNALVPWQRCHGPSEGRYHGLGFLERLDALDWAAWAAQNGGTDIVLYGISMGAATVMMASGEREIAALPVKAVIADCGFSSITAQIKRGLKKQFPASYAQIMAAGSLITKIRAGFFWRQGDCKKCVSRSALPKLFIHGTADKFVPFAMLQDLYDAAAAPKAKLAVDGAEHALSQYVQSELYWSVVDSFLRENSLGKQ